MIGSLVISGGTRYKQRGPCTLHKIESCLLDGYFHMIFYKCILIDTLYAVVLSSFSGSAPSKFKCWFRPCLWLIINLLLTFVKIVQIRTLSSTSTWHELQRNGWYFIDGSLWIISSLFMHTYIYLISKLYIYCTTNEQVSSINNKFEVIVRLNVFLLFYLHVPSCIGGV